MTVGQNITNITIITLQIGYEERIPPLVGEGIFDYCSAAVSK